MKKTLLMQTLLPLFLCVALLVCSAVLLFLPTEAAATFTSSASAVKDGAFTVTVTVPGAGWRALTLSVAYDSSKIQLTEKPAFSTSAVMGTSNYSQNYTGSSVNVGGIAMEDVNENCTVTFKFKVVNGEAASATVTVSVTDFGKNASTQIEATAPAPLNVTLKTQTSTSTNTNTSTSTSTNTQTNTSTSTSTSTNTNTNTSTSTSTNTNTNTNTNSSTSAKPPVSSTVKPTVSETDKTENNSGSATDLPTDTGETSQTDTDFSGGILTDTDPSSDPTAAPSLPVASAPNSVSSGTQSQPKDMTTGMIVLISVGVAVLFCGALTVIGFLRHKTEEE